jgi:hypothetical protein
MHMEYSLTFRKYTPNHPEEATTQYTAKCTCGKLDFTSTNNQTVYEVAQNHTNTRHR